MEIALSRAEAVGIHGGSGRAKLLGLCLRWTHGDRADAEDLLGDAYLRVLEADVRGDPELVRPLAFWRTVIRNLSRDRGRHTRRWRFDDGGADSLPIRPDT